LLLARSGGRRQRDDRVIRSSQEALGCQLGLGEALDACAERGEELVGRLEEVDCIG
jgi:hypothetical protein